MHLFFFSFPGENRVKDALWYPWRHKTCKANCFIVVFVAVGQWNQTEAVWSSLTGHLFYYDPKLRFVVQQRSSSRVKQHQSFQQKLPKTTCYRSGKEEVSFKFKEEQRPCWEQVVETAVCFSCQCESYQTHYTFGCWGFVDASGLLCSVNHIILFVSNI